MDRPRTASIVSGIAASVAAFLVVSRWDLAGTLVGAAIMPVVGTLVSHWSLSGMDRLGERARRLRAVEDARSVSAEGEGPAQPDRSGAITENPLGLDVPEQSERSKSPKVRLGRHLGRPAALQWLVLSVSCLALVASVSAVALRAAGEPTIIRERVIQTTVEKTVTVTSEVAVPAVDETGTTVPETPTPDTTVGGPDGGAGDTGAGGDATDDSTPPTTLGSEGGEQGDAPVPTTTASPDSPETTGASDATGQGS